MVLVVEKTPTPEQQAIIDFVRGGQGNLVAEALAGTGKTQTLIMSLPGIPQRSVLLCAFNKRIAAELEAKIPKMPRTHAVAVRTFHAQGLAILKAYFPRIRVDASATEALVNRVAGQAISFKIRRAAIRLLRTMKETMIKPNAPTAAETLALGYEYDLFSKGIEERQIDLAVEVARDAYLVSLDLKNIEVIDFCDMVWAPIALNLEPKSRYKAVIVDELQDISEPQFEMLMRLMAPDGRFIGIGDRWQQIYDWRGSMGEKAWAIAKDKLKAKFLPLTQTFRCSQAVVKEAQQLVGGLRALPDAAPGVVQKCAWKALPRAINPKPASSDADPSMSGLDAQIHTFVLSRTNADLLDCALYLWREKTPFQLNAGVEMLDPLFQLLDYTLDLRTTDLFLKSLSEWRKTELAKAEKLNAAAWADRIEEQFLMLVRASGHAAPTGIKRLLNQLVQPNNSGVLLSTVHKVKGLEADRVFLLRQTFGRHDERDCLNCGGSGTDDGHRACFRCDGSGKFSKEASQEELNIEYVAITRARNKLIWVDIRREDKPDRRANLDPAIQRVLDFHIVSDDSQLAMGTDDAFVAESMVDALEQLAESPDPADDERPTRRDRW